MRCSRANAILVLAGFAAAFVGSVTRRSVLLSILVFVCASPASAVGEIFEEIFLIRGVERMDGTPLGAAPHFFEACIAGPDISASVLPTVDTPPSTNFPAGSTQAMNVDGDEFCFIQTYGSVAALVADFPNGSYTVTASNVAETSTDTKGVTLSSADPSAYAGITDPAAGGSVSANDPTAVDWTLVDQGGCDTGLPGTCLDFFVVFATVDELGMPGDEVYYERIQKPAIVGTTIPGGTFQAGVGYLVDVETRRGSITDETSDTLGLDVTVFKGAADIHATSVTGAATAIPALPTPALAVLPGVLLTLGVRRARPRGLSR
jgi:hypothetical protein